jgi:hypothetical protein
MDALTSLAWNPAAPPEVKARLRPAPSQELDSIQYQIDRGLRLDVSALEAYAGPAGLAGLAVHDDPKVRAALGRSWWMDMPEATRRVLLADPDPSVRASVAGHPHGPVPEDLHAQLLADEATREHLRATPC